MIIYERQERVRVQMTSLGICKYGKGNWVGMSLVNSFRNLDLCTRFFCMHTSSSGLGRIRPCSQDPCRFRVRSPMLRMATFAILSLSSPCIGAQEFTGVPYEPHQVPNSRVFCLPQNFGPKKILFCRAEHGPGFEPTLGP